MYVYGDAATAGQPIPIDQLLPSIGTAVGNVIGSAKPAVQRAAEYEANLKAAIARGAPISVVDHWRAKLQAARYEVAQQQQWDAQQQQVLGGVRALQVVGVLVGLAIVGYLVKKTVS